MTDPTLRLKKLIRDIADFPKPGIMFRDITPLLSDASGLALSVELSTYYRVHPVSGASPAKNVTNGR